MHSAVWSLVEMEHWLVLLIIFFHFALKHYFISKTVRYFWCTMYWDGSNEGDEKPRTSLRPLQNLEKLFIILNM